MKNTRLVYSTDPKDNQKCEKCKELLSECECTPEEAVGKYTPIFSIEKNGRGGKIVTVIQGLPKNESFLKDLCTQLKKKCGSGGTSFIGDKSGIVEIQGEKREAIKEFFTKQGIKFKG